MYPPVFSTCNVAAVTTLLGSTPVRLYPFGAAPQDVAHPYAVWQVVAGAPENTISDTPDIDSFIVQMDVYGQTAASVHAVGQALRDAIEPYAHIVSWRGETKEADKYRFSFDTNWWVHR